jgi:hypothetical protein
MDVISTVSPGALYNERLAIVLGFVTLAAAVGVMASCRLVPFVLCALHKDPSQSRFYQRLSRWHAYFWWIFIMVAVLHIFTAFFHTGFPKSGDSDAGVHWVILGLAFTSLVFFPLVLSTCRIVIPFWNVIGGKSPLGNRFYKWFYTRHGLWWWPWALAFLGHVAVAYAHTGIWPR